jgi:hypothetical protein
MPSFDRRSFLSASAASAVAATLAGVCRPVPAGAVPAGVGEGVAAPPDFPPGIPLFRQRYQNWSKEIVVDAVWTCSPRSADDVVTLANWAHASGHRLRPRGAMHGWTPFTIENGENLDRVVLVDTMTALTGVTVDTASSTVTAGAGAGTLDHPRPWSSRRWRTTVSDGRVCPRRGFCPSRALWLSGRTAPWYAQWENRFRSVRRRDP